MSDGWSGLPECLELIDSHFVFPAEVSGFQLKHYGDSNYLPELIVSNTSFDLANHSMSAIFNVTVPRVSLLLFEDMCGLSHIDSLVTVGNSSVDTLIVQGDWVANTVDRCMFEFVGDFAVTNIEFNGLLVTNSVGTFLCYDFRGHLRYDLTTATWRDSAFRDITGGVVNWHNEAPDRLDISS